MLNLPKSSGPNVIEINKTDTIDIICPMMDEALIKLNSLNILDIKLQFHPNYIWSFHQHVKQIYLYSSFYLLTLL